MHTSDGTSTMRLNTKKPSPRTMDVVAYQFGHSLGVSDLYRREQWLSVEAEARRLWKQKYPQTAWFEIRHAVHLGWQYARGAQSIR